MSTIRDISQSRASAMADVGMPAGDLVVSLFDGRPAAADMLGLGRSLSSEMERMVAFAASGLAEVQASAALADVMAGVGAPAGDLFSSLLGAGQSAMDTLGTSLASEIDKMVAFAAPGLGELQGSVGLAGAMAGVGLSAGDLALSMIGSGTSAVDMLGFGRSLASEMDKMAAFAAPALAELQASVGLAAEIQASAVFADAMAGVGVAAGDLFSSLLGAGQSAMGTLGTSLASEIDKSMAGILADPAVYEMATLMGPLFAGELVSKRARSTARPQEAPAHKRSPLETREIARVLCMIIVLRVTLGELPAVNAELGTLSTCLSIALLLNSYLRNKK